MEVCQSVSQLFSQYLGDKKAHRNQWYRLRLLNLPLSEILFRGYKTFSPLHEESFLFIYLLRLSLLVLGKK